jgi:hypothetical protein
MYRSYEKAYGAKLIEFHEKLSIPKLQLLLDQEECEIDMYKEDFKRDIKILMADKDVQFKVNKLKIMDFSRDQVHILDWLLLKSPNLIDLSIDSFMINTEGRGLEI